MMEDARISYQQSVDRSHSGHPTVIHRVQTGRRGRPAIEIDPQFLQWAHNRRSISSLARFLGIGRTTLRNALLQQGLLQQAQGTVGQPAGERQNHRDEVNDAPDQPHAVSHLQSNVSFKLTQRHVSRLIRMLVVSMRMMSSLSPIFLFQKT